MAAAGAALTRLDTVVLALESYREDGPADAGLDAALEGARQAFCDALDDDLNVSAALAAVFDLVRDLNRRIEARSLSTDDAARAVAALRDLDRVLGVLPEPAVESLDADLRALLDDRDAARAARDWAASDRLRDELAQRGIAVEDTRDGQRWRRIAQATRG
jgi:cysteinyl-tRNA synthetase